MALSPNEYQAMIKRAERLGVDRAQLTAWADTSSLDRIKAHVYRQIQRNLDGVEARHEDAAAGIVRPAPGTPTARPGQVAYARDLLIRHIRSGDGGGFVGGLDRFIVDGQVSERRLALLSPDDISTLIDSLRGTY
jgi:hypothetical protein